MRDLKKHIIMVSAAAMFAAADLQEIPFSPLNRRLTISCSLRR